ncbi:MAG: hypothetical protein ACI4DX_15490 [Oliverpabstia sp.]
MPLGDKYLRLTHYLNKLEKESTKMTFAEIENELGEALPASAYVHQAFWSNSTSHEIAYGWLNTGFRSEQINIQEQTIVFRKKPKMCEKKEKTDYSKKEILKKQLDPQTAVKYIRDYFYETVKDEHGRYKSWEHCYKAFGEHRGKNDNATIDYLSLHLAFYLASWGMYRGSSFLLQKDYKIHGAVVSTILEGKYDVLRNISAENLMKAENLDLLMELSDRIKQLYANERPSFEGNTNNVTDTLTTKILLGTLGCVPAYDRYYVQTVRQYHISSGQYNACSVRNVAEYYVRNKDVFEVVKNEISQHRVEYPAMKLMDMCMWQAAFVEENSKEEKM